MGCLYRVGGHALQVLDDRRHGFPQAVDVQPVEADPLSLRHPFVVMPEPLGEPGYLLVRPHPGGPPLEGAQHFKGVRPRIRVPLHVAVHLVAVRPVALDSDKGEPVLPDQTLADAGPPGIVLGGAVRGLAQEDAPRLPDTLEEWIEILRSFERVRHLPHPVYQLRGVLRIAPE